MRTATIIHLDAVVMSAKRSSAERLQQSTESLSAWLQATTAIRTSQAVGGSPARERSLNLGIGNLENRRRL